MLQTLLQSTINYIHLFHCICLCLIVPMGPGEDQGCKGWVSVDTISAHANIRMYISLCHFAFVFYVMLPMLQCNRVALYVFSKPLHTGYADHGIPLKGRPPQSPDELQVERKT